MIDQVPGPDRKIPQDVPEVPQEPVQEPIKSRLTGNSLWRSLLIASCLFSFCDGLLHAAPPYPHQRAVHYKGEVTPIRPAIIPTCTSCPQYAFGGGPYLGFSLGGRTNYTSDPSAYKGLEGTLSAGYGVFLMPRFYIAAELIGEVGASLQHYASDRDANGNFDSPRSTWNYGLSILPGFLITDNVLGYFRLGVIRTRFTDLSGSATGGQMGLGMQTALNENWDLRGEYIYDFYQRVDNGTLGSVKSDQYNVGLVYKFL